MKNRVPSTLVRSLMFLSAGAAAGVIFIVSCGRGPGSTHAGTGGEASCGSCTLAGPLRTADTDLAQLASGTVACTQTDQTSAYATKVVEGPFVLTDAASDSYPLGVQLVAAPKGADAASSAARFFAYVGPAWASSAQQIANRPNVHGARLFVGEQEDLWVLCTPNGYERFSYSGFRPYAAAAK